MRSHEILKDAKFEVDVENNSLKVSSCVLKKSHIFHLIFLYLERGFGDNIGEKIIVGIVGSVGIE